MNVCSKMISLLLALSLLVMAYIPVQVLAADPTDWDLVDWTKYDWKSLDNNEIRESLTGWLKIEASFEQLFAVYKNVQHAAFSESLSGIISDRFCADSGGMINALLKENAETQEKIIFAIVFGVDNPQQFKATLENIKLTSLEYEEAGRILSVLATKSRELLGIDVQIPVTGDLFSGSAIAMLVASGLGGVVLHIYKKRILNR